MSVTNITPANYIVMVMVELPLLGNERGAEKLLNCQNEQKRDAMVHPSFHLGKRL